MREVSLPCWLYFLSKLLKDPRYCDIKYRKHFFSPSEVQLSHFCLCLEFCPGIGRVTHTGQNLQNNHVEALQRGAREGTGGELTVRRKVQFSWASRFHSFLRKDEPRCALFMEAKAKTPADVLVEISEEKLWGNHKSWKIKGEVSGRMELRSRCPKLCV